MEERLRFMRRLFTTIVATACLLFAHKTMGAASVADLTQKGDVFYAKLQSADALKCYLPAEKIDPNNAQLLVRIAHQYRHLMRDAGAKQEKTRLGMTAVAYARRAVSLSPEDPDALLAVASAYGKLLPLLSTKEQIDDSRIIKSAVDKVIALDESNDLAWHVLGRWYLGLAEVSSLKRALAEVAYGKLPTAHFEDAARCFEKAIRLNPNRLMHYIELGRAYADMGRTDEARKLIAKGLAMQNTEKDDATESKERGREFLSQLH